jgi:hypothetical protein
MRPWPAGARYIAVAAALNVLSELAKCLLIDFQPQGRYLLLPTLLLACVAIAAPSRRWPRWPQLFIAVLAVAAVTMELQLATKGR